MKIIRNIVASSSEPKNKYDMWLNTNDYTLHYQGNDVMGGGREKANTTEFICVNDDYLNSILDNAYVENPEFSGFDAFKIQQEYYKECAKKQGVNLIDGNTYNFIHGGKLDNSINNKWTMLMIESDGEEYSYSSDISAAMSIYFPKLGIGIEKDLQVSKCAPSFDGIDYDTMEVIDTLPSKDPNTVKEYLHKHKLDILQPCLIMYTGGGYAPYNKGLNVYYINDNIEYMTFLQNTPVTLSTGEESIDRFVPSW